MSTFGDEIRKRLQQLRAGFRKIDASSRKHAQEKHNACMHISKYRLQALEAGNADDLKIAELCELATVLNEPLPELLNLYFQYHPELVGDTVTRPWTQILPEGYLHDLLRSLPKNHPQTGTIKALPAESGNGDHLNTWSAQPHCIYGMIGLEDWTMWPLLPPGTIVRVNTRQRTIAPPGSWHNDYERPIYFLEIRNGFACGWCHLNDKQLILAPHPLSPSSPRSWVLGREAEVRGRVVGHWVDPEFLRDTKPALCSQAGNRSGPGLKPKNGKHEVVPPIPVLAPPTVATQVDDAFKQ